MVIGAYGDIAGVLKIANPAFTATELEAQDLAAELIAEAEPSLRVAVPIPNTAGEKCTTITGLVDRTAFVRLLRYLPGGTLLESGYVSPSAVAGLGEVAGRVSRALEGFSHPGLDRVLQWDLRYGADVVAALISHVADPSDAVGSKPRQAKHGRALHQSPTSCPGRRRISTSPTRMSSCHARPVARHTRTGSSTSAT